MSTDIELKLGLDADQATKAAGGFRKEYVALVKAIEKPLRQVNGYRELEQSLESIERQGRAARDRVRDLGNEIARSAAPNKELTTSYRDAVSELRRLDRAEDSARSQLLRRRKELQGAGVDTRNLAAEQRRLNTELSAQVSAGRADAALANAKSGLGVGGIENAQRGLVDLREQYRLVTSDASLSVKQRSEAEAAYRRQVSDSLAELRKLRAAAAAPVSKADTAAALQREADARRAVAAQVANQAAVSQAMDNLGITRLRELRAQLVALKSDYARLTQSGVLSATERAAAEVRYQARLNETKAALREVGGVEAGGGLGLTDITARLAGIVAAGYTVKQVAGAYLDTADAVNTLEDRMLGALPVQDEYERSQARLEEISKRVRIPVAQTSELFLRSVKPLQEMGYSTKTTADMVAVLSAGLVTSNVKGEKAVAVINQLSKGLQTGEIRGDAFNAMLENAPTLIDALTKGLGVSRGELIRMADAGELTTERFVGALSKQSEALLQMADNMRVTAGDARGTFSDSIDKVVHSIDNLLGVSALAVSQLDKLSGVLDSAAEGDGAPAFDMLADAVSGKGSTLLDGLAAVYKAYGLWRDDTVEVIDDVVVAEEKAREASEAIGEQRLSEMRTYAADFNGIQQELAVSFKDALDAQVAVQRKASSALNKARTEQLSTEKRYRDALEKINAGAAGPASYGSAQALQMAARQALASGDVEGAKRNAQAALEVLTELAAAGENTYGFAGFIKQLQGIEQEADKISVDSAEKSLQAAKQKTREWKAELDELKDLKIVPSIDDAALAKETEKLKAWAAMIGKDLKIDPRELTQDPLMQPGSKDAEGYVLINEPPPVPADFIIKDVVFPGDEKPTVDAVLKPQMDPLAVPPVEVGAEVSDASAGAVTDQLLALVEQWKALAVVPITLLGSAADLGQGLAGGEIPGFANGGKLRGPGTGRSDSILMWGSNGEFMQPASSVDYYGEGFMEAVRQRRFPKFADGGRITDRALPAIPTMSPALMQSDNQLADWGRATLDTPGGSYEVLMREDSFSQLLKRTALKHGGTVR
jgi:tape measure domain-containing protein